MLCGRASLVTTDCEVVVDTTLHPGDNDEYEEVGEDEQDEAKEKDDGAEVDEVDEDDKLKDKFVAALASILLFPGVSFTFEVLRLEEEDEEEKEETSVGLLLVLPG